WLNWTVKQKGETSYLIAVNNSYESHEITFKLPQQPVSVKLTRDQGAKMIESDSLLVAFDPLDVLIYEIKGIKL
ncbi:MAG: hypothetical protein KAH12_03865, partial [Anaerolineales bacterium]|nr:hypothetical protein [Anaerolineales bacterium]